MKVKYFKNIISVLLCAAIILCGLFVMSHRCAHHGQHTNCQRCALVIECEKVGTALVDVSLLIVFLGFVYMIDKKIKVNHELMHITLVSQKIQIND